MYSQVCDYIPHWETSMYHAGEGARTHYVPCWGGGHAGTSMYHTRKPVPPTLGGNKYVPQPLPLDLWAHQGTHEYRVQMTTYTEAD